VATTLNDLGYWVAQAASADEALPLLKGPEQVGLLFSDGSCPAD